jgi:hypothetical protein
MNIARRQGAQALVECINCSRRAPLSRQRPHAMRRPMQKMPDDAELS